jgi:Uma2 family endonuclease
MSVSATVVLRGGVVQLGRATGCGATTTRAEVTGGMPEDSRSTLGGVPTLVQDPAPVEFERLLERRRALGQDLLDEVWEGVYVMNPAPAEGHADIAQQLAVLFDAPARSVGLWPRMSIFNLGEPDDYRIPDGGLLRERTNRVYAPTAALVVEIISPRDDTPKKVPFYAKHRVEELVIVDPQEQTVEWLELRPDGVYAPVERSGLVDLSGAELAESIDWPAPPEE